MHSAPDSKKIGNKSLSFDYRIMYFLFNNHYYTNFMRNPNFDSKVDLPHILDFFLQNIHKIFDVFQVKIKKSFFLT